MKHAIQIAMRDFKGFFGTPIGWISACIIFLISGIVFYIVVQMLLMRGQSMDPASDIFGQIIGFVNYVSIFIIPAFTMKTLSDELHTGTYRLLSSSPISFWTLTIGKFLGVYFYFGFIGFLMFIYPLYAFVFTDPDIRSLFSGWFGMMLNTGAIIAISLFISSLTKNSILSYLGSSFLIIFLIFSGYIPGIPDWYKGTANILELSQDFSKGLIKSSSLAIFAGIILTFLSLTQFVLSTKRWRS